MRLIAGLDIMAQVSGHKFEKDQMGSLARNVVSHIHNYKFVCTDGSALRMSLTGKQNISGDEKLSIQGELRRRE